MRPHGIELAVHRTGTLGEGPPSLIAALSWNARGVVRCSEEWSDWSLIFALSGAGLELGSALVRLLVCTNPGERIDEDCVTVERGVTLS